MCELDVATRLSTTRRDPGKLSSFVRYNLDFLTATTMHARMHAYVQRQG